MGLPFLDIIGAWKLTGPRRRSVPAFHCIDEERETRREDVACPGSQSSTTKEQRGSPVARTLQPERRHRSALRGLLRSRAAGPTLRLCFLHSEDAPRPQRVGGLWEGGVRPAAPVLRMPKPGCPLDAPCSPKDKRHPCHSGVSDGCSCLALVCPPRHGSTASPPLSGRPLTQPASLPPRSGAPSHRALGESQVSNPKVPAFRQLLGKGSRWGGERGARAFTGGMAGLLMAAG